MDSRRQIYILIHVHISLTFDDSSTNIYIHNVNHIHSGIQTHKIEFRSRASGLQNYE